MTDPPKNHVPVTIRDTSRIVAWLWRYAPAQWLTYEQARRLAQVAAMTRNHLSQEPAPVSQGGPPPHRRDRAACERPHHNAHGASTPAAGTGRELR